jgi:RimJ/RimL family protein N-acetyltransferase
MTEPDFAIWKEQAIAGYAADKMKAGNDTENEAIERSKKEFDSLLPDGLKTKGHRLFSVVDEGTGQKVGMVWYGDPPGRTNDMIWIYDIRIDASQRGKGYGTAVLKLVEDGARELGKKRVGLHVFGHNYRAMKLYEGLGYKATNVSMAKHL